MQSAVMKRTYLMANDTCGTVEVAIVVARWVSAVFPRTSTSCLDGYQCDKPSTSSKQSKPALVSRQPLVPHTVVDVLIILSSHSQYSTYRERRCEVCEMRMRTPCRVGKSSIGGQWW